MPALYKQHNFHSNSASSKLTHIIFNMDESFLRSRNLHAWQMMVCSGQFPPTRTMFSGIILKTKTLLDIICTPVVITLLFLVKTLAILYPGFFMQFYCSAIICLFLFNCLTILVVM